MNFGLSENLENPNKESWIMYTPYASINTNVINARNKPIGRLLIYDQPGNCFGFALTLGDDQDVSLTHVADAGVLINDDKQLQFRDNEIKINSSADGQLDIDADNELEITSTLVDLNGGLDVSGNITTGTSVQTTTIDYTDGTLALTVAANGALTTSGNLAVGGTLSGDGSGLTGVPAGSLASDNLSQGDAAVTLSTSSGAVNITPAPGSAIVLDGTILSLIHI